MDNFLQVIQVDYKLQFSKEKGKKKKINRVIDCTKSLVGFQIVLKQYVDQLDCI
jgi:hypothetical protein